MTFEGSAGTSIAIEGTSGLVPTGRSRQGEIDVRVFQDSDGREWEVVVGRESWGTVVAIFIPREDSELLHQALLDVTSADEGNRILQGMNLQELQALLGGSVPKTVD